jgi:hypothetical protein
MESDGRMKNLIQFQCKCKCGYKKTITNDEGKAVKIKYTKEK